MVGCYAGRRAVTRKITLHKGIDYAVLMLPHQTTDAPLAHLYGRDREVTKYGRMFSASPELLAALKPLVDYMRNNGGDEAYHDADGTGWLSRAEAAIAAAEKGRSS